MRFLFVSLATYTLVHLALGMIVSLIARPAVHMGERIRPHLAARGLLALRLLPAVGAALSVAVVGVPSYLSNEPEAPTERVGYGCMIVALLGLGMWAVSIARGLRAAASFRSFSQHCGQAGRLAHLPGAPAPSYIVDSTAPLLALAGIVRPRLAISRGVLRVLTAEELAAALRHERAHRSAHDNLKRLCILSMPGILPLAAGTRTLERGWRKFAEWAADDRAVAGSERRSCALAAALVRVARIAADSPRFSLASSLLGDTDQLEARVDRLLRAAPPGPRIAGRSTLALGAALLMSGSLVVAILQPAALYSVHQVLERLEHFVE
ncbi:MAG TPA: M48 family metalloprotease [Bryobacteraceae bacterium]|nr:M48 family metalloprotease [Bryobacteraceae bacterium]